MSYRKLKADRIFDGYRFIEEGVLILNKEGIIEDMIPVQDAGDGIEIHSGILSPGFVNCHCHLELSHMKGLIPERTGLVEFVFKVVTKRYHSDEEITQAIEKAENEMLSNGIVAVGDICNNTLTISQKQKGRVQYYNFIEASGWLPSVSQVRFEKAKNILDEFSDLPFQSSMVPHAPYSVSGNLWKEVQPYFKDKVVSIHNQETAFEDEFFLSGTGDFIRMYELMKIDNSHHLPTGKTSLQTYFDKLSGANTAILVHNTFTSQEDVDYLKFQASRSQLQAFICLCVNANRYIEGAMPPVEMFRKNDCTIVLGTDSLASNWSLSILDEINTIRRHFPFISLEDILRWATINGARALNLDERLGSFERGKMPGIILLDTNLLSVTRLS